MRQFGVQQTKQQILVVDDHESVLNGTIAALKQYYLEAEIHTAQSSQETLSQMKQIQPQLVMADLSIPETIGGTARTENGIQLLKILMEHYPTLNLVVQSAHIRSLVRLKPMIGIHEGGFTVIDKSLPIKEMLIKVDWALQGVIYTPKEMRNGLEVKPEWIELLFLAFLEGLQDKAIAKRMNVTERTVRHYWTKVQDALSVYPDAGKSLRIQTQLRAKEEGLID